MDRWKKPFSVCPTLGAAILGRKAGQSGEAERLVQSCRNGIGLRLPGPAGRDAAGREDDKRKGTYMRDG